MNNDSISNQNVLSKCLSLLTFDSFSFAFLDWGVKKLTTPNLMRICVASQLGKWESYAEIEEQIRARKDSKTLFGVSEISGSQISRRMNSLPSTFAQRLFLMIAKKLHDATKLKSGHPKFGKLHVIDGSSLHLGPTFGKWAYVTQNRNQVKFHTRLVVASPDEAFPDKVIPSTGNVDEREVVMELVTDPEATYLFDRGYVDYGKMDEWLDKGIFFAMRINDQNKANILETYDTTSEKVIYDARVVLGTKQTQMRNPVRLVEFKDEEGRLYRIVTNRWDLSADEVAELYRNRWVIELFFKWLKQHLRVVKLQSTKPQGIWNQIFFAMTAYCLALYVQIMEQTKKSTWRVLELLRIYSERSWETFWKVLHRKPQRASKGRKKSHLPRSPEMLNDGGVAYVKPVGERRSKIAKYLKR
ncbi:IS4 family transposase [Anaerobacillus isosaccharinicus]|uniref:IS4 family transposase n=1 Tax=Anaerobacillus isosaccharinicus TaxID=1532552 RepID=A0A7S7L690_9BACI|nr:IS4 family transposase [Anaerobacillus isosaccharinicus]MBA5586621.1 IS4 family transposase [Anaerobacillus isosaccharinicus]QOY35145.1 IS4 family transposase [Anaerobacillus isosaccharinicus]